MVGDAQVNSGSGKKLVIRLRVADRPLPLNDDPVRPPARWRCNERPVATTSSVASLPFGHWRSRRHILLPGMSRQATLIDSARRS